MYEVTITRVDHDSWIGYYIGDKLYRYCEYEKVSTEEVENEALLQAIEEGLMKSRKDPHHFIWVEHMDMPEFEADPDLYDATCDQFSSELPDTLTEFVAWIKNPT
jgi:hypothetical protein